MKTTKKKLNSNARKWVRALRSGKYKRGQSYLARKSKRGVLRHCCLGVACELFAKEHRLKRIIDTDGVTSFGPEQEASFCPERVTKWLGLTNPRGEFDEDSLVRVNDSGGSFRAIADLIESQPKGLFA
jgi:hypothetical protein